MNRAFSPLALDNPDESRTWGGQAWERILTSVLNDLTRKIATSLSIAIAAAGFLLTCQVQTVCELIANESRGK